MAPIYTFSEKQNLPTPSLIFEINDNNFDETYDVPPSAQARGTFVFQYLLYHQYQPVPEGQCTFKSGLYVDPLDFEKQMAYLLRRITEQYQAWSITIF